MRAQTATMAVPCMKCGQLFDLSYDLARLGGEYGVDEVVRLLRGKDLNKIALCWGCRSN